MVELPPLPPVPAPNLIMFVTVALVPAPSTKICTNPSFLSLVIVGKGAKF